jgi:serine/threonine protein kinase/Cu/Zn superoxide dismutase
MTGRDSQLEAGQVVAGYRIDHLISRGGMGVVYRATNVALNRIYALKVLAPELADDEQFRERFQREIRIAASLHHPNIVAIHYAGEQDGMLFLAMDLVDGVDLREVIVRSGALAPDRAVSLLAQITSALDAAHGKGMVHRDVKPANVLISVKDGEEHAYLTDFGLAKRFDNATAVTVQGAVVGTVDYMPPEQIRGDNIDARTDIYALGCVFFQMLTGKVPYQRDHSVATLFAHVYDAAPSLEGPAAASHPTLGPVVAKAMAKDPAERYLSAGDFARDAAAALRGERYTGAPRIVATGDARPQPDDGATRHDVEQPSFPPVEAAREPVESKAGSATFVGAVPAAVAQPPAVVPAPSAAGSPSEPGPKPGQPPQKDGGDSVPPGGHPLRRHRWPIAAGLALIAVAVIAVIALGGSSPKPEGDPFGTALNPVPDNRVTASGAVTVLLNGNHATVTISATGLLNGASHLMHIHAGGEGVCPPPSAARLHDGHLTISTTDAGGYYGPPVVALTTVGDTSPRSIIDFTRYPVGGTIRYRRTIELSRAVVADIREGNAVIVIHGIDYNGNGVYDGVLGTSDLSNRLTAESTDPALCGSLAATPQTTAVRARSGAPAEFTATLKPNATLSEPMAMFWCSMPASQIAQTEGALEQTFKRAANEA